MTAKSKPTSIARDCGKINKKVADRLLSYQYKKELEDPSKSNRERVSRLANVVSALNNEKNYIKIN